MALISDSSAQDCEQYNYTVCKSQPVAFIYDTLRGLRPKESNEASTQAPLNAITKQRWAIMESLAIGSTPLSSLWFLFHFHNTTRLIFPGFTRQFGRECVYLSQGKNVSVFPQIFPFFILPWSAHHFLLSRQHAVCQLGPDCRRLVSK